MPEEILLREKYGPFGREKIYVKPEFQDDIVCVESSVSYTHTYRVRLLEFLRQVFLPQGYPDSVSSDYFNYQIWDTVQAFCSTLTGTLAARAIMAGIGVGSADATPLAAAITWIFKDGTGMVGSICFAWWKGTSLDADCKKWRLTADVLNDVAFCLELLLPFFRNWSTLVLCVSTTLKAVVGVAGGATRAAITQHQAIRDNMADVSAKDGSQERFVNLTACLVGIFLLSTIPEGWFVWVIFALLTIIHIYANFKAVQSLTLTTLNYTRYCIILDTLKEEGNKFIIESPKNVNRRELSFSINEQYLGGFKIILGASLSTLVARKIVTYEKIKLLQDLFHGKKYMLIPDLDSRIVCVVFKPKEKPCDVIEAFFHANLLTCMGDVNYDNVPPHGMIPRKNKRPLGYLFTSPNADSHQFTTAAIEKLNEAHSEKFSQFLKALHASGWTTTNHHLIVDEWRVQWTNSKNNETIWDKSSKDD
ncbi:RUS family member 1 [Schistocerca serialis cubense]|uniref:RUS family member 1 n=1 Tax=Schistocerca serialis cubense TaxID=2023355 RepID=UPI00214EE813|nr:RUS family member 1 [Schistocerca serialis cubense]